eukprot:jgi/Botrbrau1/21529/Bobra.174_2s0032.1
MISCTYFRTHVSSVDPCSHKELARSKLLDLPLFVHNLLLVGWNCCYFDVNEMTDGETETAFRSLIRGLSSLEVSGSKDDRMEDLKKNAEILQKQQLLEKYAQRAIDLGCKQPTSPLYVLPVDLSEASAKAFDFATKSVMKPGDQLILGHFVVEHEGVNLQALGKELESKIRTKFLSGEPKLDPEPLVELMILTEKDFNRFGIAKAIAAWASKRGATMIIMATHETGLKVKMTGTVADHLTSLTNIPISIVGDKAPPSKKPSFWRRTKSQREE